MADTYITEQDRYVSPSVYGGSADESIHTRAAANLSTMSGQMTLLKMQELQNSVSMQDMSRRKTLFEEDQRMKKQTEMDDFSGFLGSQANEREDVRMETTNQYLKEHPNLLQNQGAMQMFSNFDLTDRAKSAYNQRRVADKRLAIEEKDTDFDADNQDKFHEASLLQIGNTLDKAKIEKEAFDTAIASGRINDAGEVHRLLEIASLPPEVTKGFSDVLSDLRGVDNNSYTPALVKMAGALSTGTKLDESYEYKLKRHTPIMTSLGKKGISLNYDGTEEEFEASIAEAEKNIPLKFPPEEAKSRLTAMHKAAEDLTEFRSAKKFSSENMDNMKAKLAQVGELSKRVAIGGDPEAKVELERLLSEVSISAGKVEGRTQKNMEEVARMRELDKESLDTRVKETSINKKLADIYNSKNDQDRKDRELELNELLTDEKVKTSALARYQDMLETATGDDKKRIEKQLSILSKSTVGSGGVPSSAGSTIPR